MKLHFSALAGYGHLYPLLPLAIAARDAGHEVTVSSGAELRHVADELGMEFVPAGRPIGEVVFELARSEGLSETPTRENSLDLLGRVFGDILPREVATQLLPVFEARQPDLVVHDISSKGPAFAAQRAGIPTVAHGLGRVGSGEVASPYRERLSELAADLGVAPDFTTGTLGAPYVDICPASLNGEDFVPAVPRLPLRPVPYSGPGELPAVARADRARPLVYLTLGTEFGTPVILRRAITGLSRLDVDVLVAIGPRLDSASLGELPPNVTVERWIPQARVLPHVDVVVHHAGSGTMLAALVSGVPQLLLPQGADQFENTDMVATAGAGIPLRSAEITAEAIGEATRRLLSEDSFREHCAALAAEIAAMPAPSEVVRRLPEFA